MGVSGFVLALVIFMASAALAIVPQQNLEQMLKRGAAAAWYGSQHPTETSSSLGTIFVAQYYVMNHFMGNARATKLDATILRKLLLEQQLADGSWMQVHDANLQTGMLEGTVWAYWALKVMGEDTNSSSVMIKARTWIIAHGGIERCNTMHRLFFSYTANLGWSGYSWIPLWIFQDKSIEKWIYIKNHVSQWVYPHLTAMAWLIHFKPSHDIGPLFHLNELHAPSPAMLVDDQKSPVISGDTAPTSDELNLIHEIFKMQQPRGSFGTYTLSTMLSVLALQDVLTRFAGTYTTEINDRIAAGIRFLEELECNAGYHGDTDHGEWWDAVLLGSAMREAGMSVNSLLGLGLTVAANQQKSGGVPFGYDFEYAPDTDDTALSMIFWNKLGSPLATNVTAGSAWLEKMQNSNGGFGAFSKGCDGSGILGWLIELMAKQFEGSAEIFDPSEADVTAHILEAWGILGMNVSSSKHVAQAVNFVKSKQEKGGYWIGRWAINTIYCSGAVVSGLSRIGYPLSEPWVIDAIKFILSKQNQVDGGWGESSASYVDSQWIGKGLSTPTQTAWAVLALLEAEKAGNSAVTPAIERGMAYLDTAFSQKLGTWQDPSCVGTGHPKLIYMQYPSYPLSWPLLATARYYTTRFGRVPQL